MPNAFAVTKCAASCAMTRPSRISRNNAVLVSALRAKIAISTTPTATIPSDSQFCQPLPPGSPSAFGSFDTEKGVARSRQSSFI